MLMHVCDLYVLVVLVCAICSLAVIYIYMYYLSSYDQILTFSMCKYLIWFKHHLIPRANEHLFWMNFDFGHIVTITVLITVQTSQSLCYCFCTCRR